MEVEVIIDPSKHEFLFDFKISDKIWISFTPYHPIRLPILEWERFYQSMIDKKVDSLILNDGPYIRIILNSDGIRTCFERVRCDGFSLIKITILNSKLLELK